jgi:hypothetical protein
MASNVAGLIREGISAFKAGRRQEALKMLSRATELDERNEEAWLWLSAVVDTLENQQICLENVLAINPNNTRALQGLEAIRRQISKKQQSQPSSAAPFDLNAPVSSPDAQPTLPQVAPAQPGTTPPAEEGGYHGSGKHVTLPSEDEYDAWVEGLGLAGGAQPEPPKKGTDPFDFDGGPFQPASVPEDADFGQAVEESSAQPAFNDAGFGDADFGEAGFGDMVSPEPTQDERGSSQTFDPFALPQASAYDSGFGEEEEDFGAGTASGGQSDPFADLEMAGGTFSSASPFATMETAPAFEDANDLVDYLNYIPEEIKATHLPGKGPTYPRLVLLGLLLVSSGIVVAFIGMLALVLNR